MRGSGVMICLSSSVERAVMVKGQEIKGYWSWQALVARCVGVIVIGGIYFTNPSFSIVGAVGLISIHLAFYQMNPWPTALRRILNLWKSLSSTPVEIFCFLAEFSETILQLFLHAVQTTA